MLGLPKLAGFCFSYVREASIVVVLNCYPFPANLHATSIINEESWIVCFRLGYCLLLC